MKRELSPMSHRPVRRFGEGHTRRGACMALVDARFLMWLAQQGQSVDDLGATLRLPPAC